MIWVWVGVAALVVAAAALVPLLAARRRHRLRSNDEEIAARSRYHLLGHYVDGGVDPASVDDPVAAAGLRTARERWHTAGATLATARTEEQFRLAERIADEGLTAVGDAHSRLGLDGPPPS